MGTLRDLRRGDKDTAADSEKVRVFERLEQLRTQHKTWQEIAQILADEGHWNLTANALRKRYARWSETETPGTSPVVSEQEQGETGFDQFQKSRMESSLRHFDLSFRNPAIDSCNALGSQVKMDNLLCL